MCLPVLLVALQSVPSSHRRSLWRRERRTYGDGDSSAKQEHLRDKDISQSLLQTTKQMGQTTEDVKLIADTSLY